jgi:hypothetical protein
MCLLILFSILRLTTHGNKATLLQDSAVLCITAVSVGINVVIADPLVVNVIPSFRCGKGKKGYVSLFAHII